MIVKKGPGHEHPVEPILDKDKKEHKIGVPVTEYTKTGRVTHLATLRIYHQRQLREIEGELEILLKDDVDSLGY